MTNINIKTLADTKINTVEKIFIHLNPGKSYTEYYLESRIDQMLLPRPKGTFIISNLKEFPITSYDATVHMARKVKARYYLDLEKQVKEFNKSKVLHESIKEKARLHRLVLKKTKPKRDAERAEAKKRKELCKLNKKIK